MRNGLGWVFKRLSNMVWSDHMMFSMCTHSLPSLCLLTIVRYTPAGTYVAAFHFTIAILPNGPTLISHPPVWYKSGLVKTEKELEDEELKNLLSRPLREPKKKKKKAAEGEKEN